MGLPIITVSRQYGSAGRDVARQVAETLQIPYYDKEVISMTAEKTGFSEEVVKNEEMKRYVLHGQNICSVFINAPLPDRIQRVKTFYNRKERDIRALILRTDKERKAYYEYYTDKKWGDSESYDLMINSSIGLDLAKDMIVLAAKNWKG